MPVIKQAKGIIMAQCSWPEDQAFDALCQASQRENIKLRDRPPRSPPNGVFGICTMERTSRYHPSNSPTLISTS